ncbi:pyruvate/oxaloacetate carboxyltransferase, partial [Thermodesulfovibrionales bacterium]|nr:pyruvate/oxaloacetate carboxyltransferase [Thermodesulfovibrionales bacterium]
KGIFEGRKSNNAWGEFILQHHRVKITDTTLRDGHQSLWATRMRTEEMLPILEKIDQIGYHSLEVWGGATFDVCLRYLDEDPWERLRSIKKIAKNTPLQMLLRGQSAVGYAHYPDDVVEAFVSKTVENGMDIIRIFDALNDVRNMEPAIKYTKAAGGHAQGTVCYTISPVHTTERYLQTAEMLAETGVDSIAIKDMAGLLAPDKAYEMVKTFKEKIGLPVYLHCHFVGGMAVGAYIKAIEAGVDVIDTASAPLAFGASQPAVELMVKMLENTPYATGLSLSALFEIAAYFEELRQERGYKQGVTRFSDMRIFDHQVPGGMITNLVSQLKEQKALFRLYEVLQEITLVREELGYPPLVTPTSQIVGAQAVFNVLTGKRYKLVPGEVRAYAQGLYGEPPAKIDPDVLRKVLGDKEVITCRPADLLKPKMDLFREEIKDLAKSEEDVISYAMFPQVAKKFFQDRVRRELNAKDKAELMETKGHTVSDIKKKGICSQDSERPESLEETQELKPAKKEPFIDTAGLKVVAAPMVGTFYQASSPGDDPLVEVGQTVKDGQVLGIIEAMKLMYEIETEFSGEIVEILVDNGQSLERGQPMVLIRQK